MVNALKRPAFWYCLTLALAISLGSVGLIILIDFGVSGSEGVGRLALRPGGGLVALTLSTPGEGTCFRLTLPVTQPDTDNE